MKFIVFALTIALLSSNCFSQYTRTTVEVASYLNYPKFIIGLRNKVEDFLTSKKINMMLDVQELQAKDLNYRATALGEEYKYDYYGLEERFDREFERLSKKLILTAERLDQEGAPLKEKSQFIESMKQEAEESIDQLIRRFSFINTTGSLYKNIDPQQSGTTYGKTRPTRLREAPSKLRTL
jgi:hypothetical protein